ncbi:Uncharacterised protein [Mycobacteroides abscessus subsp. abscessus]|nr:Uncharacterised protein [Mycobacteroides abscessus subsp. abscessus]
MEPKYANTMGLETPTAAATAASDMPTYPLRPNSWHAASRICRSRSARGIPLVPARVMNPFYQFAVGRHDTLVWRTPQ